MSGPKIMKFALIVAFTFLVMRCMFIRPDYLKNVTAGELHRTMKQGDIFLVDVHIPVQPHIKGTDLFVPYNEIEENLDKFPTDKSAPIYLYCKSGPMGNAAARTLKQFGYSNLTNLSNGAEAWKEAGFEFERTAAK